jgi:peptidoglycan hydrolase-like protein with peptidoglycan-binding domain
MKDMAITRRILRLGSRGPDVVQLQHILASLGYYNGPIDGIFGPRTFRAVQALQRENGLVVDGIVGPRTYAVIDELIP